MRKFYVKTALLIFFLSINFAPIAQVRYDKLDPDPFPDLVPGKTNNQFYAQDFDSDGDTDFVFWNGSLDQYYKNNGDGTYTLISDNTLTPFAGVRMPVFGQENTVMEDFDGDEDLDILYFDNLLHFHIYLENNGRKFIPSSNPFANFIPGSDWNKATVNQFLPGDFDNDGDTDMLYSTGSINKYYQNNGAGTFTHFDDLSQTPFAILPSSALPTRGLQFMVKADFDSDNDIDIFYYNPLTGVHHYLLNHNGVYNDVISPFPNVISGINGGTSTANRFQAGDFDADGDVDLVYWTPSVNQYYANNGNGTFTFFPSLMNTPFEGINGPSYGLHQSQITDLDHDGDIDIISNEGPAYSALSLRSSPPMIKSVDPENNALNVPIHKDIILTFSTPVIIGKGNIYILKTDDDTIVETIAANSPAVTGSGTNTITINPVSDLLPEKEYAILFDYNAFKDIQERAFGDLDLGLRRITDIMYTSYYAFTTIPAGFPMKLRTFYAKRDRHIVELNWETIAEFNAKEFLIERSNDGILFTSIGKISAKGMPSAYTFMDTISMYASYFYRLKLIDLDAKFTHSNVVQVNAEKTVVSLSTYPNPVKMGNYISILSAAKKGIIKISGLSGNIFTSQLWIHGGLISTNDLPAGVYILELESNGKYERTKIVVY